MPSPKLSARVIGADASGLEKAFGVDDSGVIQPSNVVGGSEDAKVFQGAGAVEPPHPPGTLQMLYEHSAFLRQCVDAYATNVDGFGHRFEPTVDFDASDADQHVADLIAQQRADAFRLDRTKVPVPPTDDEVAVEKRRLVALQRAERRRLERWFKNCTDTISFAELRRRTRTDIEVLGNGYWEVLRNGAGEIAEFVHVPGSSVRVLPADKVPTLVRVQRKRTDVDYESVERRRYFRRYVQSLEGRTVWFKELSDPRTISSRTGRVYEGPEALRLAEGNVAPATEMLHFKVHSSRSVYGIPRWIGVLLSVLGARQAEEINFSYFDNKGIPPLALLVSGGSLSADSVKRVEDHVEQHIKGRQNFHKMLVIEAEADGATVAGSGDVKLSFEDLSGAQQKDALFQNYDERSGDKIGQAFRLPRLLRGDTRDFNRATADAALEFAEQQVFGPEREAFDNVINTLVLPSIDARYWRFVSNAPALRDPAEVGDLISKLVTASVLTPAEARELAEMVFNKPLKHNDSAWTKVPVALTLAGVTGDDESLVPWTGDGLPVGGSPRAAFNDTDADGSPDPASGPTEPKPLTAREALAARDVARVASLRNALAAFIAAEQSKAFRARLKLAKDLDLPDSP